MQFVFYLFVKNIKEKMRENTNFTFTLSAS
jgi:hypothetical protein